MNYFKQTAALACLMILGVTVQACSAESIFSRSQATGSSSDQKKLVESRSDKKSHGTIQYSIANLLEETFDAKIDTKASKKLTHDLKDLSGWNIKRKQTANDEILLRMARNQNELGLDELIVSQASFTKNAKSVVVSETPFDAGLAVHSAEIDGATVLTRKVSLLESLFVNYASKDQKKIAYVSLKGQDSCPIGKAPSLDINLSENSCAACEGTNLDIASDACVRVLKCEYTPGTCSCTYENDDCEANLFAVGDEGDDRTGDTETPVIEYPPVQGACTHVQSPEEAMDCCMNIPNPDFDHGRCQGLVDNICNMPYGKNYPWCGEPPPPPPPTPPPSCSNVQTPEEAIQCCVDATENTAEQCEWVINGVCNLIPIDFPWCPDEEIDVPEVDPVPDPPVVTPSPDPEPRELCCCLDLNIKSSCIKKNALSCMANESEAGMNMCEEPMETPIPETQTLNF